ncbi:terminase small subunit [Planomicrobium okeanokoites]|uniref:terminase small subunit n=1 Tax=Planomicrobium okeanokoites TaxID=244 RepID=UPI0009FD1CBF|nr:terminase small subunit [Planomicrobium okeanokoites]
MDWQAIRGEFESSSITLKALAEKHDIKLGTLKSRKSREEWSRESKGATNKKDATKSAKVATRNPVIESKDITEKQQQFCLHYIRHFNATKAYREAYECDYRTAHANAHRVMANDGIQKEIRRLKAEMQNELFVSAGDIAREYMKMAFADITDFLVFGTREVQEYLDGEALFDADGNPETRTVSFVEFKDYTEVDGTMIQEIKQGRDGVSIKLYDKQKAMQELDKRLLSIEDLKVQKLQAEIDKLHREGSPDTSTEDKLKDYFTALGGAFRDN